MTEKRAKIRRAEDMICDTCPKDEYPSKVEEFTKALIAVTKKANTIEEDSKIWHKESDDRARVNGWKTILAAIAICGSIISIGSVLHADYRDAHNNMLKIHEAETARAVKLEQAVAQMESATKVIDDYRWSLNKFEQQLDAWKITPASNVQRINELERKVDR